MGQDHSEDRDGTEAIEGWNIVGFCLHSQGLWLLTLHNNGDGFRAFFRTRQTRGQETWGVMKRAERVAFSVISVPIVDGSCLLQGVVVLVEPSYSSMAR